MAQTNINIRMDSDLKKQFDLLCSELGFTMTTAFNVFARTMSAFPSTWLLTSPTKPQSQR